MHLTEWLLVFKNILKNNNLILKCEHWYVTVVLTFTNQYEYIAVKVGV